MPTVSIVLPTYNRATQLLQAVESVLTQTAGDWELLIVDDGSTDATLEVLRRVQTRDQRIRCFRGGHRGVSAARNLGIREARGRFVAFLDDDDLWLPEKLERQLTMLSDHPAWAFVYTQAELRYADGRPGKPRTPLPKSFEALLARSVIALPSVLMRREILVSVGGFNEAMDVSEDIDLWLRVASSHAFGVIPDILTVCHQSRDRNTARYERALRNHLLTLHGLLRQPLELSRRKAVIGKLAKLHYGLARTHRSKRRHFRAAREFLRAVRTDVAVGLAWRRDHVGHPAVYFVKPYLGIVVSLAQGVVSLARRVAPAEELPNGR